MAFRVACRPQSNPRSTSSNGIPPELEVLGFYGILCITGLTGCPNRSDWSTRREPVGEDRIEDPCVLAHSIVWPDFVSTAGTKTSVGVTQQGTCFRSLARSPRQDRDRDTPPQGWPAPWADRSPGAGSQPRSSPHVRYGSFTLIRSCVFQHRICETYCIHI